MNKNVRYFKVSVDNVLLGEVQETLKDISNDGFSIRLGEMASFTQFGLKVSFVTKFSYDVAVSITGEDFEASEDILMIKFFEDVDFGEEELL